MEEMGRRSARFRVHLTVKYESAAEFVNEYAENLSAGGLFVAGATDLKPLDEIGLEIELPSYGTYRVRAQVAHVIDADTASRVGCTPGAGLAIIEPPPSFSEALLGYLARLGRRADVLVLVEEPALRVAIARAGYQTGPVPDPGGLVAVVAHTETPILRVVVRPGGLDEYAAAAAAAGDAELVMAGSGPANLAALLPVLDDLL